MMEPDDLQKRLKQALQSNTRERVTRWIQAGANVDRLMTKGQSESALHLAVREGCKKDTVQLIINHISDIDAKDEAKGQTSLHIATGLVNLELVLLLLDNSAKVNLTDTKRGDTALHRLARRGSFHKDACAVAEALLGAGACPLIRNGDDRMPMDLCRRAARLHKILDKAENEWRNISMNRACRLGRCLSNEASLIENSRLVRVNQVEGKENQIVNRFPALYPNMQDEPQFIRFVLNRPRRQQYKIFSMAFCDGDMNGSLGWLYRQLLPSGSRRLGDYVPPPSSSSAIATRPSAAAAGKMRQGTELDEAVSSGTKMLINILREALKRKQNDQLDFIQGRLTTEHQGDNVLLNVLVELFNGRPHPEVLRWLQANILPDNFDFPDDHLSIVESLTNRGKRAFFNYMKPPQIARLLEYKAAQKDEAFFESFLFKSGLDRVLLGPKNKFQSIWDSRGSELFLAQLRSEHWIKLLQKFAREDHASWLCRMGALHRCLLSGTDASQVPFASVREHLTTCWHGMTVLEMACFMKNIGAIEMLYEIDSRLLTDSEALTLTTDEAVLLKLRCLWKDVKWKAAHDLACSRAPEKLIYPTCKLMINSAEHLCMNGKVNPVSLAVRYGRNSILAHYLHFNSELANKGDPSPLWYATITRNVGAVHLLLPRLQPEEIDRAAPDGTTPSLVAKVKGYEDIHELIRRKASGEQQSPRASVATQASNAMRNSVTSGISELSREFPMHVEPEEDKAWTQAYSQQSAIPVDQVREKHLLNVCGLSPVDMSSSRPSKVLECILQCKGHGGNESSQLTCAVIRALTQLLAKLETQLARNKLLKALGLRLSIIGSIIESTRLGLGTEMDANILFRKLNAHMFRKAKTCYSLRMSKAGYKFFKKERLLQLVRTKNEKKELNVLAFMTHLLREIRKALTSIELPSGLAIQMTNDEFMNKTCKDCDRVTKAELATVGEQASARYHCAGCLPAVTMTRLGPCIQLIYQGKGQPQELVCTVDLIPLFPHPEKPFKLIRQMVLTPLEERMPGWEKAVENYIDRDRFLQEGQDPAPEKAHTLVALKLQHFGAKYNYMIRGTQDIDMQELRKNPRVQEAYIALKVAKEVLGVQCSSYMLKKILLQDSMLRYINKFPTSLQLFYEALIQPELKPIFEEHIDLQLVQQKINEQQTDIVIYRSNHSFA